MQIRSYMWVYAGAWPSQSVPMFKVFPSSRTPQLSRACELLLVNFVVFQLKVSLYDPVGYKTVGDEYVVCDTQILRGVFLFCFVFFLQFISFLLFYEH